MPSWEIWLFLLISSLSLPCIHYLRMRRYSVANNRLKSSDFEPEVTIFIPVKNESTTIVSKLNEVMEYDYPMDKIKLLIIESCSSDGTREIAKNHLKSRSPGFPWKVISLDVPGKSIAVNKALEIIDTDFFIMMDCDAKTDKTSIKNLINKLSEENVGAVCGRLKVNRKHSDYEYRSRFNIIRAGESLLDSTPIFEGSLCAFRVSSLAETKINPSINADDTQLALISRKNGFRSIVDHKTFFSEKNEKISRPRKIRRAQGLVRVLIAQRNMCFGYGKFSWIMANTIYFYVIFPALFIALFAGLVFSFLTPVDTIDFDSIDIFLRAFVILAPLSSKTVRGIFAGCLTLLQAQIMIALGNTMEIWNPER